MCLDREGEVVSGLASIDPAVSPADHNARIAELLDPRVINTVHMLTGSVASIT